MNRDTITTLNFATRKVLRGVHVKHEFWLDAYPDVVIQAPSAEDAARWLYLIAVFLAPAGTKVHEVTFTTQTDVDSK